MTNLVKAIAKTPLPKEFLEQIDMKQLIVDFREDYDRLDELSEARSRHQSRNAIGRWWNRDELKDAQLDAAELQASFSKKLGQLMAISVAQAKELQQQQTHLVDQQQDIQQQTLMLEASDQLILKQQQSLTRQQQELDTQQGQLSEQAQLISKQQQELAKLVQEYFEIKGLTMDGAKKLIQIAQQVEATESAMRSHVDKQLEQVDSALEQQQQAQQQLLVDVETQLQGMLAEVTDQLAQTRNELGATLDSELNALSQTLTAEFTNKLEQQLSQQAEQLTTAYEAKLQAQQLAHQQALAGAVATVHNELRQELEQTRSALQHAQLAAVNELSDTQVQLAERQQAGEQGLQLVISELTEHRLTSTAAVTRLKIVFIGSTLVLAAAVTYLGYLQLAV